MTLQTVLPANSALIPADALRSGTRLEDYEIESVLARSAVAMVYRAQDRRSKQTVAIKEFLPTGLAMRSDDGQVVAREANDEQSFQRGRKVFLEEAQALAKCQHPCLMGVLRIVECNGTVYKVMPFCPGPTLLEHRQKMATAPTERLFHTWLEGLLGALTIWHGAGRVHGGVSPGNILMLADDRPILLDSDAVPAAILSDRTRSMIAALGPCFSPQEQCEPGPARPVGPWTDFYALAATLRFCVSGQLPGTFAHRPLGAWFESEACRLADAGEAAGAQGRSWRVALDACLAESAKDRPQGAAQLSRLIGAGRPRPLAAIASATTGLAPLLSSPVVTSRAPAARPTQSRPDEAMRDDVPDMQDATPAVRQPSPRDVQMSLPLALQNPGATALVDAGTVDAMAEGPDALVPRDAALGAAPRQAEPTEVQPSASSRGRTSWAAGLLVLVAIAAGAAYMFRGEARPGTDEAKTSTAAQSTQRSVQPALGPSPAPASARQPVAQTEAPTIGKPDARIDAPVVRSAAASPPQGKPASPQQPRKPVAAKTQGLVPSTAKALANDASPRQGCTGKERYALLQCMEAQCAKKAFAKHEQCIRLRKDRKL